MLAPIRPVCYTQSYPLLSHGMNHIRDPFFIQQKKNFFFLSTPNLPITSYYDILLFFPCLEERERVNKKIEEKFFMSDTAYVYQICTIALCIILCKIESKIELVFSLFFSSVLSILHFYEFYIIGQICSYFLVDACKIFFFSSQSILLTNSFHPSYSYFIKIKEKRMDLWSSSLED